MEHLLYWSSALSRSSLSRYKKDITGYLQNSMYFVQDTCLPNLKTIAFASKHFTAAMIRSQCWFTFYFILHQIFWSPVLNDVKQLLIAAIMPSKVRFFHSGSYLGDRRWTRHSTWCSILKENSIKSKELTFLTSLDTLTFNRGPCLLIFLASIWLLTCPPHPLEWACSTMCAPYFGRASDLL